METNDKVSQILKEVKPTKNLDGITDIVEGGYLDSFELMTLISMLSEAFDVEIEVDDIIPENFNSINAIVSMINIKLSK